MGLASSRRVSAPAPRTEVLLGVTLGELRPAWSAPVLPGRDPGYARRSRIQPSLDVIQRTNSCRKRARNRVEPAPRRVSDAKWPPACSSTNRSDMLSRTEGARPCESTLTWASKCHVQSRWPVPSSRSCDCSAAWRWPESIRASRASSRACLHDWTHIERIAHLAKVDVSETQQILHQLESEGFVAHQTRKYGGEPQVEWHTTLRGSALAETSFLRPIYENAGPPPTRVCQRATAGTRDAGRRRARPARPPCPRPRLAAHMGCARVGAAKTGVGGARSGGVEVAGEVACLERRVRRGGRGRDGLCRHGELRDRPPSASSLCITSEACPSSLTSLARQLVG